MKNKMIHELKTYPQHFQAIKRGEKRFEVRVNDRNFQLRDQLILKEFAPKDYYEDPEEEGYSGEILHREISYILHGGRFGIDKDYVVLGLKKI